MFHDNWWSGMPIMWFLWLPLFVIPIAVIFRLLKNGKTNPAGASPPEILKKRYARGEIEEEKFEERKRDLPGFNIMPGLKYILPLVFIAVAAPLFAQSDTTKTHTFTDSVIYTCPMHPEVISDKPGKCLKCGMDLVQNNSPTSEHKMNMMMCPMHGMVDTDHKHNENKQGKRMMKGMGIAMGAMMVVMIIIVGNH